MTASLRWFERLPLQRKLLWLVGLALIFSMLVGAAGLLIYDLTTFRPRAAEGAQAQVQALAEVLTASVEFDDPDTAQKHLDAFGRQPGVLALAIVLSDGELFAEYVAPGASTYTYYAAQRRLPDDVFDARAPLLSEGRTLGAVHMVKEVRPFTTRVGEYAALIGAAVTGLLALTVMLSLVLRRTITSPIESLAGAARQVSEQRDYRLRVRTGRSDEIGELAAQLNQMLAAVEEHASRLHRSEETARQQLAEIENLYQNAAVGLCLLDREFRFVRINKMLATLNGRSVEDTVGRTLAEVIPDAAPLLEPIYRRVMDTGEPALEMEARFGRPDAPNALWLNSSVYPLRNHAGEIVGATGVVLNVTDRRLAEEQRASMEAQLRQSHKMQALGTLAGGIAHDFNNVLTAITGNARLALEDLPPNHPAAISLNEISRASDRAKDLVRRILAFSRQEQADRRLVELKPVVEEALRLLRATVPTMIDIRVDASPNLPKVFADATQVHQVLMNLGTNACDAMRERGGVLTVRLDDVRTDTRLHSLSPDLHPGRYLRIRVTDTGVGIKRELIERIFDPFFTTKAPGEGTGLGLSVVHGIMRSHGGAVLVESEQNHGSVFDLYFPAADTDAGVADAPDRAASTPRGKGEHILYVDDEEALVFLVTRMMQRMGYRITGLHNGREAIDAVRADPQSFDLVITDLGMPGMSGMDLAAELLRVRPDLPIIVTSGYVRAEDLKRAEDIGVRDVVLKPGTVDEMGALIRQRLGDITAAAR